MHSIPSSRRFLLLSLIQLLGTAVSPADEAPAISEARFRAELLHETINGALQVMHRDFFKEEDRGKIPSSSLEDVFARLEENWNVKVSWMSVNAKPMSIDHKSSDRFEKSVARAIEDGADSHEALEGETFRYAGAIVLGNQCLKCHVPHRTSLEDRKAAVLISMPVPPPAKP